LTTIEVAGGVLLLELGFWAPAVTAAVMAFEI
jgi:hypothetical protein